MRDILEAEKAALVNYCSRHGMEGQEGDSTQAAGDGGPSFKRGITREHIAVLGMREGDLMSLVRNIQR